MKINAVWTGSAEGAFFNPSMIDKHRVLQTPEEEYTARRGEKPEYYIGVDVGRVNCTTEACVWKGFRQTDGKYTKSLVHIESYEAEHFEYQAINLKKLYKKFNAKGMCLDTNGIGGGLMDYMVKRQVDPDTGETLPPFGPMNDDEKLYRQFETGDMIRNSIYMMKANAKINSDLYAYAKSELLSGRVKMLTDERTARTKLLSTKAGSALTPEQRVEHLKPFIQQTILEEQMLNLIEENEGTNIILKHISSSIKHDKFSAFIYGLFMFDRLEKKRKRGDRDFTQMAFFSNSGFGGLL